MLYKTHFTTHSFNGKGLYTGCRLDFNVIKILICFFKADIIEYKTQHLPTLEEPKGWWKYYLLWLNYVKDFNGNEFLHDF